MMTPEQEVAEQRKRQMDFLAEREILTDWPQPPTTAEQAELDRIDAEIEANRQREANARPDPKPTRRVG